MLTYVVRWPICHARRLSLTLTRFEGFPHCVSPLSRSSMSDLCGIFRHINSQAGDKGIAAVSRSNLRLRRH
jgi:hypothetical protein